MKRLAPNDEALLALANRAGVGVVTDCGRQTQIHPRETARPQFETSALMVFVIIAPPKLVSLLKCLLKSEKQVALGFKQILQPIACHDLLVDKVMLDLFEKRGNSMKWYPVQRFLQILSIKMQRPSATSASLLLTFALVIPPSSCSGADRSTP